MLQGIKEAAADMSPYVRKTAAHAIPKLAETDESCHDELIEIISRLLGDKELILQTRLYYCIDPGKMSGPLLPAFFQKAGKNSRIFTFYVFTRFRNANPFSEVFSYQPIVYGP